MTDPAASQPSSPRRTRARRGEGARLREEILEAAEALLLETGDESAVSIRAVAEAAGCTPPSIYRHFPDKNELLYAVCDRHFAKLDTIVAGAIDGVDDPIDALREAARTYVRFGIENPEHYRIMLCRKPLAQPVAWDAERVLDNADFRRLLDLNAAAIAKYGTGQDPLVLTCAGWAAVHGLVTLYNDNPRFPWPDFDALVDTVVDMVVATFRRPPPA